jgi:lipopolysaccharide transport system ATP-binding protein
MPDCIIQASGLGKKYRLGAARHDTLRDSLVHAGRRLLGRGAARPGGAQEFWALRDVSFAVNRGEVVGVIGRNGAGKSTLLKVLSRITEPTTGSVRLRGRIASLLEVGTGFHPELSGRENIFLNGAILGMSREEIQRKFDEIVAFAEVERFLDTPVKHYSSGMYVRLAFAVAAHLEPEILIVDEVLAVGDAQFQQKCLGKMKDVTSAGRTVLLVSHNMAVVQSLCDRVLLMESGRLALNTAPAEAISRYLAAGNAPSFHRPLPAGARCIISAASLALVDGAGGPWVTVDATVSSHIAVRAAFETRLYDAQGQILGFGSLGTFESGRMVDLTPGDTKVRCRFSAAALANGHYSVGLKLTLPFVEALDELPGALGFDLELPPAAGSSHRMLQSWNCGAYLFDLERLD